MLKDNFCIPPSITCPNNCGTVLDIRHYFPAQYFKGLHPVCPQCQTPFNLWYYATNILNTNSTLFNVRASAFIGGHELIFDYDLPPNDTVTIDLANYGVPDDAIVIEIFHTPFHGAGYPMLISDPDLIPKNIGHKLTIYGRPYKEYNADLSESQKVQMYVTYIPNNDSQFSFNNLATAYDYFTSDNLEATIVPCATAVEYSFKRFVPNLLTSCNMNSKLNPKFRLSLEVIVPLCCEKLDLPMLEIKIINHINELWKLRHEIAHEGKLKNTLNTNKAANILTASMFTINYIAYIQSELDKV